MADPRSNLFSVKQCPPQYLGKSSANIGSATQERRDFFNSVGKVGDLEVLNSVGGGKVGQGLRTLASVSNTIRQGCGALPTSIGSAVGSGLDAGVSWVLDNVGIASTTIDAVRQFQPGIANQALGQAESIFQQVKAGNFKTTDVPGALQDLQNLERLGRNIFTPSTRENQSLTEVCEASPYAIDLVARAPKFKFLFVVEFVFNQGYGSLHTLAFPFVVKRSSRPNIRYQMEEVNYYNYRTKVVTKTEFEEMNMSFHDDTQNYAMRFYNAYLRAYTPIANIPNPEGLLDAESNGMNFAQTLSGTNPLGPGDGNAGDIPSNYYTGSSGPLASGNKTLLQEIRLMHVFDFGQKMNVFRFFNPRISQLQLDEVDMSMSSEGTDFSCTFAYDSVYVVTDLSLQNSQFNTEQRQANPIYPLRYNGSAGTAGGPNNSGIAPFGTPVTVGDGCDPNINTSNPPT